MKKNESRLDLFRYGIISPLIYGEETNIREYCKRASMKTYTYNNTDYMFSEDTIRKWYYKYKKEGFEKLNNTIRNDKEKSRKLNTEVTEYIISLREKFPRMTVVQIYKKLKQENYIDEDTSIDTFYRYIRTSELRRSVLLKKERRRYEMEYPNDTWQGDTTYGPYIIIKGKKYRVYLIHFIDDNSRLIVGYGFYLSDNASNVEKVLKKAISKYGIPKQIYLDNGSSYKNRQLAIICARLGIKLTHTHAYDPEAKGKVERCFKTIKEGWMYARDWNKYKTIEEIEKDYSEYLYDNYINKIHSELDETPNNVWHKGILKTKFKQIDKDKLEEIFMQTEERKVNNDRTVSLNNKLYEVPFKYVGQKIELRHYIDQEEIWIYVDNERKEQIKELNKKDNAKVKRTNNINYEKLVNKEEDVEEYSI